jgi:hypothetical protein
LRIIGLRDLRRRNVRGEGRLAEYADVDHQGSDALTLDLLLEEGVFGALGVQCADDGDDLLCDVATAAELVTVRRDHGCRRRTRSAACENRFHGDVG